MSPSAAKPTAVTGPQQLILISEWKPYEKNTLRGFVALQLPSGLILKDCTFHQKNDSQWVGLPAKQIPLADGRTSYIPLIDFSSKEARVRFQAAATAAIVDYLERQ